MGSNEFNKRLWDSGFSKSYIFSEIADIIESSDNAENNIYDIVDFMIGIMTKDQLNQVEDMLTNQYPED